MFGHKSHSDSCNRFLDRNSSIHKRKSRSTNRSHTCRSSRSKTFTYYSDRVWEAFFAWNHKFKSFFCESSMTNFSSSCSSHSFSFSSREWRKVIVMEVSLLNIIVFHVIENKIVGRSSKSYSREHLSISSPKKSTSMYSREIVCFAVERSDIKNSSIVDSLSCFNSSWADKCFNCIENSHFEFAFSEISFIFFCSLFFCKSENILFVEVIEFVERSFCIPCHSFKFVWSKVAVDKLHCFFSWFVEGDFLRFDFKRFDEICLPITRFINNLLSKGEGFFH